MKNGEIKVIFQESSIVTLLLAQGQKNFEELKNEDLSNLNDLDDEIFFNACEQIYVIGKIDEASDPIISNIALTNALNVSNPKKEFYLFPSKHYLVGLKLLNLVVKDNSIKDMISKKDIIKTMQNNNFLELLKNDLSISPIFEFNEEDMLYVLAGKASNATWNIIDWIANPITTLRIESNPEDEHSGICLVNGLQLKALYGFFKEADKENINKYLNNIFIENKEEK